MVEVVQVLRNSYSHFVGIDLTDFKASDTGYNLMIDKTDFHLIYLRFAQTNYSGQEQEELIMLENVLKEVPEDAPWELLVQVFRNCYSNFADTDFANVHIDCSTNTRHCNFTVQFSCFVIVQIMSSDL